MKLTSLFTGKEFDFTLKIGQDVLNLDGKQDWIMDIIYRKQDCSVLLGVGGYVVGSKLQEYNNRFNKF